MSFLNSLSEYVNLRYAVMLLGIVLFVIGILVGWHEIRTLVKLLLVFGAIAFAVGLKFNALYNVTPPPITISQSKATKL
jgi:hypothetical protein